MTCSAGTLLGIYEMLSPLGAGGMGEVWRARNTRLGPNHGFDITADGRQFVMVRYGDPRQGSGDLILVTNWK